MIALLLAIVAGYGVHLVYSSVAFGWDGFQPGPPAPETNASGKSHFIEDLGLGEFDARSLVAAIAVLALMGFTFGIVLFNGIVAGVLLGMFAATVPVGVARIRHEQTINLAHQEWPSLIEEIRLLTGSLGRSIPQATFEVGLRSGDGLRPAFEEAHREWTISTDFNRSMRVLKGQLAHNTADIVAETLLTAHELGGGEVGNRLQALAQDRLTDQQHRQDAVARQAGVRFARWFTLVVPIGMAFVGISIGDGREAYADPLGQALVAIALLLTLGCWLWAGQIMQLPEEDRVFE